MDTMRLSTTNFSQTDYDEMIYQTSVAYQNRDIAIAVYKEEEDLLTIVEQVNEIVVKLSTLDHLALQLIVEDLFESYNAEGSLTVEEFTADIELISLYFVNETEVEFTYAGGDLLDGQFLILLFAGGEFDGSIAIDE